MTEAGLGSMGVCELPGLPAIMGDFSSSPLAWSPISEIVCMCAWGGGGRLDLPSGAEESIISSKKHSNFQIKEGSEQQALPAF